MQNSIADLRRKLKDLNDDSKNKLNKKQKN